MLVITQGLLGNDLLTQGYGIAEVAAVVSYTQVALYGKKSPEVVAVQRQQVLDVLAFLLAEGLI